MPETTIRKATRIFIIVGIFAPGFGAIAILGLQTLISLFGIECAKSFLVLKYLATVGIIVLPFIFLRQLKRINSKNVALVITIFNILVYIFIQAFVGLLLEDPNTLCYVTDGQNGMLFVPAAWVSLPVLYIFGRIADKKYASRPS